jgi:hypothetical protein
VPKHTYLLGKFAAKVVDSVLLLQLFDSSVFVNFPLFLYPGPRQLPDKEVHHYIKDTLQVIATRLLYPLMCC